MGRKLTREEAIRKQLNISPDVPLDRQITPNFVKNKWANYVLFRSNIPPHYQQWIDEWFESQGIDIHLSAIAPKKKEEEQGTPVKRKFDTAKIEVNAEAFFKLVRNVVKGNIQHYEGKAGINFVTKHVIGARDPREMWVIIRDNILPEKRENSNVKLSDKQETGGEAEAGLRTEETSGAVGERPVEENVGERPEGVDRPVGKKPKERAGEPASVPAG